VFAYQTWGVTTMCRYWKGGDGAKKFEIRCSKRY